MNNDPVVSIRKDTTCLENEQSLFLYSWPGINKGCNCVQVEQSKLQSTGF